MKKNEYPRRIPMETKKMTERQADIILAVDAAEKILGKYNLRLVDGSNEPISGDYKHGEKYFVIDMQGNDTGIRFNPEAKENTYWRLLCTRYVYEGVGEGSADDENGYSHSATTIGFESLPQLLAYAKENDLGSRGIKYEYRDMQSSQK